MSFICIVCWMSDVWVDTCNCVCNVLYYILICVFVFQGQIKPLYEINPIETTDVSVIPTRTRNKWRPMRDLITSACIRNFWFHDCHGNVIIHSLQLTVMFTVTSKTREHASGLVWMTKHDAFPCLVSYSLVLYNPKNCANTGFLPLATMDVIRVKQ